MFLVKIKIFGQNLRYKVRITLYSAKCLEVLSPRLARKRETYIKLNIIEYDLLQINCWL